MRGSETGMTLIEVSLIVIVTLVMVAALTPSVAATISKTQTTRATTDMTTIATQLSTALTEMGFVRFTVTGTGAGVASSVELLVSDGDIPQDCTAAPTGCGAAAADSWQRPVDDATGLVDFLERHLVTNNPGGNSANDYPRGAGSWRGPYLNAPINPDPWGNRYMVNSEWFNQFPEDVDVLSAGPDASIDTVWFGNPLAAGGDDIVVLVEN